MNEAIEGIKNYFRTLKIRSVLISTLVVGVATFLQILLSKITSTPPFLLMYPAVIVAAVYGDGLVAIFLAGASIDYFFMGPGRLFEFPFADYVVLFIFIGFSLFLRNITLQLKRAKEKAEELANSLEIEKNSREQFVATLSHDLRNPISVANVYARHYLENPAPSQIEKIMQGILNATNRADRMIRDLLDANIINAGERLHLEMQECDLVQIAREVVEEKSLSLKLPSILLLKAPDTLRGYWNADAIKRILENIIGNAFKYGDNSRPVSVSISPENTRVKIGVYNYGNPLNEEEKNQIFETFKRTRSAQQSRKGGWGLGLTLVKGLTLAHKGDVTVESDPQGTTFIVLLPIDART